jgi:two-component system, cell cycle sensor histidine kinase PleC
MFPYLGRRIAPGTPYRRIVEAALDCGATELAGGDREAFIRRRLEAFRACADWREVPFADGRWIRMVERRTRDGGAPGAAAAEAPRRTEAAAPAAGLRRFVTV